MINPRVDGGRIMLLVQRRIVEEGANSGRARRWAYLLNPPVSQNPAQPVHGLVSKSTLRLENLFHRLQSSSPQAPKLGNLVIKHWPRKSTQDTLIGPEIGRASCRERV